MHRFFCLFFSVIFLFSFSTLDAATQGKELKKYNKRIYFKQVNLDTKKSYRLSGEFRTDGNPSKITFGVEVFDKDGVQIRPFFFTAIPGTETEVLKNLAVGDKEIIAKDAGQWELNIGKFAVPEFDILPQGKATKGIAQEIRSIRRNGDHYRIILKHPAKFAIPAGTLIRQHSGALPLNAAWKMPIDGKWRQFRKLINPGESYDPREITFLPGTTAGRAFIEAPAGAKVFYRNLRCVKVSDALQNEMEREERQKGIQLYPHGKITPFLNADGNILWHAKPNSALHSTDVRIPVGEVAQIEALVSADSIGMMGCFIYGFDGRKKFRLPLAAPVVPDGKKRWMIIHPDFPRGKGMVNAVSFGWHGGSAAKISVENVRLLKSKNFIPGAEFIPRNTPVELDHMLGGSTYKIQWVGTNPGLSVSWQNHEGKEVGNLLLPANEYEKSFTLPDDAVRGILTVNDGGDGFPEIKDSPNHKEWIGDWIWIHRNSGPEYTNAWFSTEITLPDSPVTDAAIMTSADDQSWIFVNGKSAGSGGTHTEPLRRNVAHLLHPGKNRITIKVRNNTGFCALVGDIYVQTKGKNIFCGTKDSWKCHLGGDELPEKFELDTVVVGNDAARRYNRLERRYLGPRPVAEVIETGKNFFTLKSDTALPDTIKYCQYALKNDSGERLLAISTKVSKKGNIYRFEYSTPLLSTGGEYTLYLDDDRILVKNNTPVGVINLPKPPAAKLKKANYIFNKGRVQLQFGDRKSTPFFWKFPGIFPRAYLTKANYILAAKSAGYDNVAISTDFCTFWTAKDKFDFSGVDAQIEQILNINPDATFMIQLGCYMPDWWLAENPDDVSVRENGSPRHLRYERQALSSQKWLKDAAIPINALIDHLENSPYGDRIWAFNVAENSNLEWFWWSGVRYLGEKPFISGFSKADLATFREHLKNKYKTNENLAAAWQKPEITFDTAEMPRAEAIDNSHAGAVLDAKLDRQVIDWFEYRNVSLGNAFITLCKIIKERSEGKLLTGGYYGYYLGLAGNTGHQLQDVGHNAFLEAARSPYVDFVRAPAPYNLRRFGFPEGTSIIPETFSSRGKLVYIECDHRSALKGDPSGFSDVPASRPDTVLKNIDQMNRIFGVMATQGIGYYWYDITCGAFLTPALNIALNRHHKIYAALPPAQGLTPAEIIAVGDRDSIYYSRRNNRKDTLTAASASCVRFNLPKIGAPFSYCTTADLLEKGKITPRRLYIMFNFFMLSKEQRNALVKRFEAEKASVLWLYNAGASYPDDGPAAGFCADFTGMKMKMDTTPRRPSITFNRDFYANEIKFARTSAPWFIPESGFDEVFARDEKGNPALVSAKKNGVTHYFSMLPDLPAEVIRKIAEQAGVHLYTRNNTSPDNLWIGNDLVFIHTAHAGEKEIILPPGVKLKKIIGPLKNEYISSGEKWYGEAIRTYGFQVVKK